MSKASVAMKLLKNKQMRRMSLKLLKNPRVQRMIVKQVSRRLRGH